MKKPELLQTKKIKCAFCKGSGIQAPSELLENRCGACEGKGSVSLNHAILCAYCKGKGRYIANRALPCIVCRGVGAVQVDKSFAACKQCKGRGSAAGSYLPCAGCQGKGVIE